MTKVTLVGSYRKHLNAIMKIADHFREAGWEVLRPETQTIVDTDGWVRLQGDPDDQEMVQKAQLKAIREADLIYVVNPGGYVGVSAALECGYANGMGIPVWFAEHPYDLSLRAVGEGVATPQAVIHHA